MKTYGLFIFLIYVLVATVSDAVIFPDSNQTNKVSCRPVYCRLYCAYGFRTDPTTGCQYCACNTPCRPVYCRLYCAYGFRTDPTTGCQYCACNTQPPSCRPVLCRKYCANGFKVNPTTGCQYCACQE